MSHEYLSLKKKNRILFKVLLVFFISGSLMNSVFFPETVKTTDVIFNVSLILALLCVYFINSQEVVKYCLITLQFLFNLAMIHQFPFLVNYLFSWVILLGTIIYLDQKLNIVAGIYSLAITSISYWVYGGTVFPSLQFRGWLYLVAYNLFFVAALHVIIYHISKLLENIRAKEEHLKFLAYHDQLTGVMNRGLFEKKVMKIISESGPDKTFCIVFLDVDNFKEINDSFGHSFGDKLLCAVVSRVKENLRTQDLVCRTGGDEFVLMINNVNSEKAVDVLGRIIDSFKNEIEVDGQKVFVSLSMGASVFPHDGKDADTLIKKADDAMYTVKSAGKNGYQFYSYT